jgi:hypothetical protein
MPKPTMFDCDFCGEKKENVTTARFMVQRDDGSWETLWKGEVCAPCEKIITEMLDKGR